MPAVDGGVVPVADAERIAHDFGLYAVDDVLVCGDFHRHSSACLTSTVMPDDAAISSNLRTSRRWVTDFFAGRMLPSAAWVVLQASSCRSAV